MHNRFTALFPGTG